jgi:hypothetical protein
MTYNVIYFTMDVKKRERGTGVKNAECRMQSEKLNNGNGGNPPDRPGGQAGEPATERQKDSGGGRDWELPFFAPGGGG